MLNNLISSFIVEYAEELLTFKEWMNRKKIRSGL